MALLYMYYVLNYVLNSREEQVKLYGVRRLTFYLITWFIWLRILRMDDRKDQILWNSETQKHGP